jgi:hypothetical protein
MFSILFILLLINRYFQDLYVLKFLLIKVHLILLSSNDLINMLNE